MWLPILNKTKDQSQPIINSKISTRPNATVNSSCAQPPPPPGATAGHLQILCRPGAGHLPISGPFPSFWPARGFLSEYSYTEDFTGKQIGLSVKDRKKFKRVVKACPWFYACISSLLIKPELHSEIGSYLREWTSFWLLNQISVDIIWKTSFHIYKTIHNI